MRFQQHGIKVTQADDDSGCDERDDEDDSD